MCLLLKPHETVGNFKQDDGNTIEGKKEYWQIVVRYNGQGPMSSCRQKGKVEEGIKGDKVIGSHTAI